MATTVNEETTVTLIDGTKLTLRPLKISLLRKFTAKFANLQEVADDNEKSMDVLIECVQIALEQYAPELAADKKALEDNLDLPTVYKIVEEASGIKMTDVSNVMG